MFKYIKSNLDFLSNNILYKRILTLLLLVCASFFSYQLNYLLKQSLTSSDNIQYIELDSEIVSEKFSVPNTKMIQGIFKSFDKDANIQNVKNEIETLFPGCNIVFIAKLNSSNNGLFNIISYKSFFFRIYVPAKL